MLYLTLTILQKRRDLGFRPRSHLQEGAQRDEIQVCPRKTVQGELAQEFHKGQT